MPMQTDNRSKDLSDPIAIKDLMHRSSFSAIVQKAQKLLKIDQLLPTLFPEGFAKHCRVMNLRDGLLVIEVNNSAIATRLRYLENQLINQVRQLPELQSISRIHFNVRPGL